MTCQLLWTTLLEILPRRTMTLTPDSSQSLCPTLPSRLIRPPPRRGVVWNAADQQSPKQLALLRSRHQPRPLAGCHLVLAGDLLNASLVALRRAETADAQQPLRGAIRGAVARGGGEPKEPLRESPTPLQVTSSGKQGGQPMERKKPMEPNTRRIPKSADNQFNLTARAAPPALSVSLGLSLSVPCKSVRAASCKCAAGRQQRASPWSARNTWSATNPWSPRG